MNFLLTKSKLSFKNNQFIRALKANCRTFSKHSECYFFVSGTEVKRKVSSGTQEDLLVGFRRCVIAYLTQRHQNVPLWSFHSLDSVFKKKFAFSISKNDDRSHQFIGAKTIQQNLIITSNISGGLLKSLANLFSNPQLCHMANVICHNLMYHISTTWYSYRLVNASLHWKQEVSTFDLDSFILMKTCWTWIALSIPLALVSKFLVLSTTLVFGNISRSMCPIIIVGKAWQLTTQQLIS